MPMQAHGPFIYIHWFGTVPSMQRQGYGGQVMKAVGLPSSHLFRQHLGAFNYMAIYTRTITYNVMHTHTCVLLVA